MHCIEVSSHHPISIFLLMQHNGSGLTHSLALFLPQSLFLTDLGLLDSLLFFKDELDVLTALFFYVYSSLTVNISYALLYFTPQSVNIIYKLWSMVGTGCYQSPGSNWFWLNQINVIFAELWPCQLTWVPQIS